MSLSYHFLRLANGFFNGFLDYKISRSTSIETLRLDSSGAITYSFIRRYLELLKRLDDSNDRIRIEAASAFATLLLSFPVG